MAESTVAKTRRDGSITFSDNAGAHTLTVAYEQGDLNLSIPGPTVNVYLDRGVLGATPSLRYGDDQPCTGTFSAYLRDVSDAAYATLLEILTLTGYVATDWVSTLGANGEVFTVTMALTIEGTDHGDSADHTITLNHVVVTGSISEGDPNTVSISFIAWDLYPSVS